MLARDFMQTVVLTVSPETPLLDIHKMFLEEEIHGAPVVADDGAVLGIVSTIDLIRAVSDEADPDAGGMSLTAADIMTTELVAVTPNTSIAEVAHTMRTQHVHRVLVIEERELVGVLTTFDLLRAFERKQARIQISLS